MDRKWKVLETTELQKGTVFRIRKDKCELPDGRVMPSYYVLEMPHWVQILPITKEGKVILVKQYRHATGEVCLELPGGASHGGKNENPAEAAIREMEEETGYTSSDVKFVTRHNPNPALQNNSLFVYVALNCEKTKELQLDPYEDIEVVEVLPDELVSMLLSGAITHSLVQTSIIHCLGYLGYSIRKSY